MSHGHGNNNTHPWLTSTESCTSDETEEEEVKSAALLDPINEETKIQNLRPELLGCQTGETAEVGRLVQPSLPSKLAKR